MAVEKHEYEGFQTIIKVQDKEKAKKNANWSIANMAKKLFGFILMLSLIKMVCFPIQPS